MLQSHATCRPGQTNTSNGLYTCTNRPSTSPLPTVTSVPTTHIAIHTARLLHTPSHRPAVLYQSAQSGRAVDDEKIRASGAPNTWKPLVGYQRYRELCTQVSTSIMNRPPLTEKARYASGQSTVGWFIRSQEFHQKSAYRMGF